jgi:CO/xanthine dehydrogenase FAD-binding subunit
MRSFELVVARNVEHALEVLTSRCGSARAIAGGTDLIPELKSSAGLSDVLVDISRLEELGGVRHESGGLTIGALVTHTDIIRSPLVRNHAPVLAEAAQSIGAVQTRNRGTLGGNLAACVPCMDSGPALLALNARAAVIGPRGEREIAIADLFRGPRRNSLGHDELLKAIRIPSESLGKPAAFLKFGLRRGQALALVNVAAAVRLDANGLVDAPAIALGAVAPTVMRAADAETFLNRRAPTAQAVADAAQMAAREAQPISDHRASAAYRRELIAVLTRRVLDAACLRAGDRKLEALQ